MTPRLALVGYGRIAPKHLEVFRALGAIVDACCNRSEGGREKAVGEGGIKRVYRTIPELIEGEKPDGIICCAGFSGIFGAAREIVPYRLPVLVEKPPGLSLQELRTLEALAVTHGTPVMVGLNRRHYSVLKRALQDAGGLEHVTAVFVEWSEDPQSALKRFTRSEVARFVVANSLHGLDLLTTLAGPIDEPVIHARDLGEPFRWITTLQGLSRRGVIGAFQSTWDSPGPWRVSVCAPGRRYVLAPLESCRVIERGRDDRVIEPSAEDRCFKAGFYDQAKAFLEVVRTGTVPLSLGLASAVPAMSLAEKLTAALTNAGVVQGLESRRVTSQA